MSIRDSAEETMDVDGATNGADPSTRPPLRVRALTLLQERRLIAYLDDRWLQFTRNFKKRSEQSSTLRTLGDYLEEARHLLAFILQIPPVDPSTSLRIAYMLRLTADVLGGIPGYSLTRRVSDPLAPANTEEPTNVSPKSIRNTLRDLLDFLDDLDHAWLAVLQGQVWDPETAEGVDLTSALEFITHSPHDPTTSNGEEHQPASAPPNVKTSPPSQTELTRLRSLLVGGQSALEEWLLNERVAKLSSPSADGDDLTGMLARMGLLDEFDNVFTRTMDVLGYGNLREDDDLEEVPMSAPLTGPGEDSV